MAAAAPVLVFVALSLITNSAHAVKTEHMAAITIATMPHVSAFLLIQWGAMLGTMAAVGASGVPDLGDAELTAALAMEGVPFAGHLALSQGAILTGLIWGAIVASVIDGRFTNAAGFAAAAAAMSLVGIIHAPGLQWPAINGVSAGYMIAAAFLCFYPKLDKRCRERPEDMPADPVPDAVPERG